MRQRDAHAWVEVFFPEHGWIVFDPSPLDATVVSESTRFRQFNQFLDNLRLRWNKYIIEYDLKLQADVAEKVGRRLWNWARQGKERIDDKSTDTDGARRWLSKEEFKRPLGVLLIVAFAGLLLVYFVQRLKAHGHRAGRYGAVLRILQARGYEKSPGETAKEFAKRIEQREGTLTPLRHLTRMYYDEKFGELSPAEETWHESMAQLRSILKRNRRVRRRAA